MTPSGGHVGVTSQRAPRGAKNPLASSTVDRVKTSLIASPVGFNMLGCVISTRYDVCVSLYTVTDSGSLQNPWAMDERGERLFPQFPLDNPGRGPEQGSSSALVVTSPPDNNPRAPPIPSETARHMIRVYTATNASVLHTYVQTAPLPSYSPNLPPIDRTRTGEDFFIHLRDAKLIAGLTQTRFSCWCHRAKDEEQGVTPGSNSKSHSDAHVAEGSSGGRYRVSKFFEHARSCNFYKVCHSDSAH
jgi:hypothetical protein